MSPAPLPAGLAPVATAVLRLRERLRAVRVDTLPLSAAAGSILARDIVAPSPVPPAAIALIDGYAVASLACVGASSYAPAPLAGAPQAVREGDRLPPGTDAVLPADAIHVSGRLAEALDAPAPGDNARRGGEDLPEGSVLRRAGKIVRDLDVALARAAGLEEVAVHSFRVEIDAPASFRPWIDALLAPVVGPAALRIGAGAPALRLRVAADAPAQGLALREGESAGLSQDDALLAPARPAALLGLAHAVIEPALALAFARAPQGRLCLPLARKIASRVGLTEIALLRLGPRGWEPLAVGALPLSAIAAAQALLVIPPASEGIPAGEAVAASLLPGAAD